MQLADFGTCAKMDEKGRVRTKGVIGTPDYIPPEILETQDGGGTYGAEADWWSAGIVLFELLLGDTPFFSDSLTGTFNLIQGHNPDTMEFPDDIEWSDDVKACIRKFLSPKSERLGAGPKGIAGIQEHPFFKSLDFSKLQCVAN